MKESPQEIPPELLEALLQADLASRAYYKALDLLARAEQCRSMLEAKLAARKYPREAAKRALSLLEAEGSLDDERYARAWLRSRRRRKAEGKSKLVAALRAKGIRSEQISRALAATAEEISPALASLIEGLRNCGGDEKAAIVRDLQKAGFSMSEIRAFERDPEE